MLSKGNTTPRWQVSPRANGRPRQIKSSGHLSCWQSKSHLSNHSWCPTPEIKPIISTQEQMTSSWGSADRPPRSMNFIRKQVKLGNNKQLFCLGQDMRWIPTAARPPLSLGHWRWVRIRAGDNRCAGKRTIPPHSVPPLSSDRTVQPWNLISLTLPLYSLQYFWGLHFFSSFPEAAIRCNGSSSNTRCNKKRRLKRS